MCSNEETMKSIKTAKLFYCKASGANDFAFAFHIESLDKNEHVITGKENSFFAYFKTVTGRGRRNKVAPIQNLKSFNDCNNCRERI